MLSANLAVQIPSSRFLQLSSSRAPHGEGFNCPRCSNRPRPTLQRLMSWSAVLLGSRVQRRAKAWVAPTVSAETGDGEEISVALGAVEQTTDGTRKLFGQIFEETSETWKPILLTESARNQWTSREATLTLSLDAASSRPQLTDEAPAWPQELVEQLQRWPLKGPGTVIFDANFFAQRGASAALRSGAPVVFVAAARTMGLASQEWIPAIAEHVKDRSLREILGSATGLDEIIQALPEALKKGHFDIANAIADEDSWFETYTVHVPNPQLLSCESCSWTLGAMLRERPEKLEPAVVGVACLQRSMLQDVLLKIDGNDVLWEKFDDIQELLSRSRHPMEVTFGRPKALEKLYLREAFGSREALEVFGVSADPQQLVAQMAETPQELVFSEATPSLFVGDGGTGSHLHVDRKPLLQVCHQLHGSKFFCVAPGGAPGPVVPWASAGNEAKLSTDGKLCPEAAQWLQRPEVSVAFLAPGDVLMFLGQSCHGGCNGARNVSLSLFHGAMPLSYMLQGAFGAGYQLMARKMLS